MDGGLKKFWKKNIAEADMYHGGEQITGDDVVKLNTNENPYPPAPEVMDVLRSGLSDWARLYPDPMCIRLREMIAEREGLTGIEGVIFGNGSDEVLKQVLAALVEPGEKVYFFNPTFPVYPVIAKVFGGEPVAVPLDKDFMIKPGFEMGEGKVFIIANPNPPVGTWFSREEVRDICERFPGIVVLDEAYISFAPESYADLMREYPRLMVVRTFSKSYSLAGLRVGYLMGDPGLVEALYRVKDIYNVNSVSQAAAIAALQAEEYYAARSADVRGTREELIKNLAAMGFRTFPSAANFIFAIAPDGQGEKIYHGLKKQRILVRYFDNPLLAGGFRISIGTPEQMEYLLEAIEEIRRR